MSPLVLALVAGIAAGALNAVGGGGTFVALPALVAAGLTPVVANASATVALVPGAIAGAWVYRREIGPVGEVPLRAVTVVTLIGGAAGAVLLLTLPSSAFDAAVPWLLLFATLVLAFGRRVAALFPRRVLPGRAGFLTAQLAVSVYGGYFGGAVGIMMLALWSVARGVDPAAGNPTRVTQTAAVFVASAVLFLIAGDVLEAPGPMLALLVGGVVGGVAGAATGRRLPTGVLRATVLTSAAVMTALYLLAR